MSFSGLYENNKPILGGHDFKIDVVRNGRKMLAYVHVRGDESVEPRFEVGLTGARPVAFLFNKLAAGNGASSDPRNPFEIDEKTREEMLVWWDANSERVLERENLLKLGADAVDGFERPVEYPLGVSTRAGRTVDEWEIRELSDDARKNLEHDLDEDEVEIFLWGLRTELARRSNERFPDSERVSELLTDAGLGARSCGQNADWSAQAWYLGALPGFEDMGANRTNGGLYLLDAEGAVNGRAAFVLIRTDFDDANEENDDLEVVHDEDGLEATIDVARKLLEVE